MLLKIPILSSSAQNFSLLFPPGYPSQNYSQKIVTRAIMTTVIGKKMLVTGKLVTELVVFRITFAVSGF